MRHITRLHIKDFQCHRDTDINLSSGINLITGSSDTGKSAILRALNGVLHNRWPSGGSYVRKGATHSEITVEFSDSTSVTRIKSETQNSVTIIRPSIADAEPDTEQALGVDAEPDTEWGLEAGVAKYEKFGTALPPEVVAALGSPPVYDDENGVTRGISYAEQLDPYFLVSLGPTALPRTLSKLTGISAMEEAVKRLDSDKRKANKRADDHARRVREKDTELEPFAALDERLTALDGLKTRRDAIKESGESIARGRALLDRLTVIERKRAELTEEWDAARQLCKDVIQARFQRAKVLRGIIADGRALLSKNAPLVVKRAELTAERRQQQEAYDGLAAKRETLISDLRTCGWLCVACGRPSPPRLAPTQIGMGSGSNGDTEEVIQA